MNPGNGTRHLFHRHEGVFEVNRELLPLDGAVRTEGGQNLPSEVAATNFEFFLGIAYELEHLVGHFDPAVYAASGVGEQLFDPELFFGKRGFLRRVFLLSQFTACAHFHDAIELSETTGVCLLLGGEDCLDAAHLVPVRILEPLERELVELRGDAQFADLPFDLRVQLLGLDRALGAARVLALGTVIVDVGVDFPVLLPLDFFLGRHHRPAGAAANEPCELESMRLGTLPVRSAEQYLNPVVLGLGNHRLVHAAIPLTTADWVLEQAIVEGLGERIVELAATDWLAAPRAKLPLIGGNL